MTLPAEIPEPGLGYPELQCPAGLGGSAAAGGCQISRFQITDSPIKRAAQRRQHR